MKKPKEYALYKGDEFLEIGTCKELAKFLGVSERTIHFYATPACRKRDKGNRYIVIKIKEDNDE